MKRSFFAISIFILAFCFGCQKSENLVDGIKPMSYASQEDKDIEKKILSFMERMEYVKESKHTIVLKNSSSISLEEAEWNLEAFLNYMFCVVFEGAKCVKTDEDTFVLPVSADGTCSEDDILELYLALQDAVKASMEQHHEQLTAVNLTISQDESGAYSLSAEYIYANEYPDIPHNWFQDYDWWYPTGGLGLCSGPYAGQCIGRDGESELTWRLHNRIPCYYPHPNAYWTDVEGWLNKTQYKEIGRRDCVSPDLYNLILGELTQSMFDRGAMVRKMLIWCNEVYFDLHNPFDVNNTGEYKVVSHYGILRIRPDGQESGTTTPQI